MTAARARPLRIALIAPPWYPVPPRGYGGIELVVHLLHRELDRLGHDVTVFGAEGSAEGVIPIAPAAWSSDLGHRHAGWDRHFTYVARVARHIEGMNFDVIHDHTRPPGLLLWSQRRRPHELLVGTLHEPVEEHRATTLREVSDAVRFVAVSRAQAASVPTLDIHSVVHNAVDVDSLGFSERPGNYLLTLARITPTKGQHLAIEVARRLGMRLVLAGKVDPTPQSQDYFESMIRPQLGPDVVYIPNVAGEEKRDLIAGAAAGLFPLQWEEPFGLALAECMVSGTPVVSTPRGAAPELVHEGVTGTLALDVAGMCAGVEKVLQLDRAACAADARGRLSPERMALDYLRVYRAEQPATGPGDP
jgi:glycosyltransferase involved in cell wall biosynthesis